MSSPKFDAKAKELLAAELVSKPTHVALAKHLGGGVHEKVELDEHADAGKAGMMLYTSGTTNRPVRAGWTHVPFVDFGIALTTFRKAYLSPSVS